MTKSSDEKKQSESDNTFKTHNINGEIVSEEGWGYDLYPERRGQERKKSWWKILVGLQGQEELYTIKCESKVYSCITQSPLIKLMIAALNSSGCKFDMRRHISCEICDNSTYGGYDPILNQVIVCQNVAASKSAVHATLFHEMIHMFDYCRNNMDFKNLEHLACTEVRAANLAHCSFMSAWYHGTASPLNVKQAHQNCVKKVAISSIMAVRDISEEKARNVVSKVFPKCYADLEPIGRRLRRRSLDAQKAYMEGPLYGYDL